MHYYDRFVIEDNIRLIPEFKERCAFWVYSYSLILFCGPSPLYATLVGYSFDSLYPRIIFGFSLLSFLLEIRFFVRFIRLSFKYQVFKKRMYPWLFGLIPVLLCIVFSIIPIWTTQFHLGDDGVSFGVTFNPVPFLFGFLPSLFAYVFYAFYAFMKPFGKYAQKSTEVDIVRGGKL